MEYEYLSWGANVISTLLFIYLAFKYYGSECFNLFETFLTLGTIFVSVVAQFMNVVIKKINDE